MLNEVVISQDGRNRLYIIANEFIIGTISVFLKQQGILFDLDTSAVSTDGYPAIIIEHHVESCLELSKSLIEYLKDEKIAYAEIDTQSFDYVTLILK
ncbi:hypothetical protein ACFL54_06865 [Planctomycetota bacterium]